MTWFVVIAIALVAGAVLILAVPLVRPTRTSPGSRRESNTLVYRDKSRELERDLQIGALTSDQYAQARTELERQLLEDLDRDVTLAMPAPASALKTALALAVALPLCAGLLYLYLGNPRALNATKHAAVDASSVSVDQFKQMTEKLAARMRSNPNDPVGWMMLGRAYKALERYPDAVDALRHAEQLAPRNPEILVEYAEALGLDRAGDLRGDPTRLLDRALQISPDDQKALTLAGTAAFGRGDYSGAVKFWERLAATVPADSELGRALSSGIAEAKARGANTSPTAGQGRLGSPATRTVSGVVRLAPALATRAAPEDALFVFARAADGPRVPLAVLKRQVKDLPLKFKLDDSMAMARGHELSSARRVIVGARVSKSGRATPGTGDLEGTSQVVEPGASGVVVVIDSAVQ